MAAVWVPYSRGRAPMMLGRGLRPSSPPRNNEAALRPAQVALRPGRRSVMAA